MVSDTPKFALLSRGRIWRIIVPRCLLLPIFMSSGVFMADTSLQPSLSVYLDYCCQNTQEVGCTFDKSINKGENPDAK